MKETQRSVSEWAVATFGAAGSNYSTAARANTEIAELCAVVGNSTATRDQILTECADVWIVYCRLADRFLAAMDLLPVTLAPGHQSLQAAAAHAQTLSGKLLARLAVNDLDAQTIYFIAGVMTSVRYIVAQLDGHLSEAVNAKMAINRNRQWRKTGDGHGQHVHVEDAA